MDRIESPDRRNFLQGAVVASGAAHCLAPPIPARIGAP